MKKSELRKIIKEEITNTLNESEGNFDTGEIMQGLAYGLEDIENKVINMVIEATVGPDSDDDIEVSDHVQGELAMMYKRLSGEISKSLGDIVARSIEELKGM